eukprot:s610_g19.t1
MRSALAMVRPRFQELAEMAPSQVVTPAPYVGNASPARKGALGTGTAYVLCLWLSIIRSAESPCLQHALMVNVDGVSWCCCKKIPRWGLKNVDSGLIFPGFIFLTKMVRRSKNLAEQSGHTSLSRASGLSKERHLFNKVFRTLLRLAKCCKRVERASACSGA